MKHTDATQDAAKQTVTPPKTRSLGLCLGASTISLVHMEKERNGLPSHEGSGHRPQIVHTATHPHNGNPKETLLACLRDLDLGVYDRVAVTGRRLRKVLNLTSISEPEAVENAYAYIKPPRTHCPASAASNARCTTPTSPCPCCSR